MGNYVYRGTPAKGAEDPAPSIAAADAFALPELEWEMVKTMSLTDYLHTLGKVSRHRDATLLKFYVRDFGNWYAPHEEMSYAKRLRLLYWESTKNKLHVYMLAAWVTRFLVFGVKGMVSDTLRIDGFTDVSRGNVDDAFATALVDAFAGHGTPVRTTDRIEAGDKSILLIDHVAARGRYDEARDPRDFLGLVLQDSGRLSYNVANLLADRESEKHGGFQEVPLARTIRVALGGVKLLPAPNARMVVDTKPTRNGSLRYSIGMPIATFRDPASGVPVLDVLFDITLNRYHRLSDRIAIMTATMVHFNLEYVMPMLLQRMRVDPDIMVRFARDSILDRPAVIPLLHTPNADKQLLFAADEGTVYIKEFLLALFLPDLAAVATDAEPFSMFPMEDVAYVLDHIMNHAVRDRKGPIPVYDIRARPPAQ